MPVSKTAIIPGSPRRNHHLLQWLKSYKSHQVQVEYLYEKYLGLEYEKDRKYVVEQIKKLMDEGFRNISAPSRFSDPSLSEDALSVCYYTLVECLENFPESKRYHYMPFQQYVHYTCLDNLRTFARNEWNEYFGRFNKKSECTKVLNEETKEEVDESAQSEDNTEEEATSRLLYHQAVSSLRSSGKLSDRDQLVFDMYYIECLSMNDISKKLCLNKQIITRILQKALTIIRGYLMSE